MKLWNIDISKVCYSMLRHLKSHGRLVLNWRNRVWPCSACKSHTLWAPLKCILRISSTWKPLGQKVGRKSAAVHDRASNSRKVACSHSIVEHAPPPPSAPLFWGSRLMIDNGQLRWGLLMQLRSLDKTASAHVCTALPISFQLETDGIWSKYGRICPHESKLGWRNQWISF